MKRQIHITARVAVAAALLLLAAPVPAAQVDYFLKISGVEGEAKDAAHKEEIELLSWSWGETNDSVQIVEIGPFVVHKTTDRATPLLVEACLTGKELTSAVLVAEKPTSGKPIPYLRYKLERCFVSSYQLGGGSAAERDSVPVDSFSLNFSKIEWEYTRHDEATSRPLEAITGGYDVDSGTFLPGATRVGPAWSNLR